MKIYLSGPIAGCSDEEANGWRELVSSLHRDVIDPMSRDYRHVQLDSEGVRACVESDKKDIQRCDIVLVCYRRPSVGTSMEIIYASLIGKKVIIVNESGYKYLSPWLVYHSSVIVDTFVEGLEKARQFCKVVEG